MVMNVSTEYSRLTETEEKIFKELKSTWPVLLAWGISGFLTIVGNGMMLLMTKCTSGGKSPIFIFMRTLFLSDLLVGIFGIFKALVLFHMDILWIDCFLPESLFVTASTSTILTLLWLSIDSCMRLAMPLKYILHMHKSNVVMWMIGLWNVSFILGFIPQMDWHSSGEVCVFTQYYSPVYLLFLATLWITTLLSCCAVQIGAHRFVHKIRTNRHLLAPTSREFRRYTSISITIRIELYSWIACFLPMFVLYIFGSASSLMDAKTFNIYILYFFPAFIIRSFVISIIRGYRTAQIHRATQELKRQVTRILSRNTSSSLQKTISSLRNSLRNSLNRKMNDQNHVTSNSHLLSDNPPITISLEDTCINETATDNLAFEPEVGKDDFNGNRTPPCHIEIEYNTATIQSNTEAEITRL
ncbi:hypothetical protein FSP39_011462 [Pinctada imbricata]|uniref:G-protein coupled receptors family 1 profile domain-containing protein n=1 Tax=Pinctada imbricata TaxID=66713 RepID=A0AA89CAI6_PINIB|nr:hypothetical protein FSP39_011462 [Pinctada imbricata]